MGLGPRTIAVAPVGCAVFAYDYLGLDFCEAPHGRAPAVATGIQPVRPDAFVLSYQGDGDLAAIGTAEIVHAAARGERITTVFVNNGIYGMTGGQMAPTTLLGQRTTSSPGGREATSHGYPLPITEMLAVLPGVAYAARGSVVDPGAIGKTKAYLRRACEVQLEGTGFGIVEVIANCPVGWGMTPASRWTGYATTLRRSTSPACSWTADARRRRSRSRAEAVERSVVFAGFGVRASSSPATSWRKQPTWPTSRSSGSELWPRDARRDGILPVIVSDERSGRRSSTSSMRPWS